jgi:tetratricopeptide (TPR) repeat protein
VLGFVWNFGLLVPLAAAGIALTWNRRRELSALFVLIATLALGVVAFYVFARYRYSLVPPLVLFAGAALVEALDRCGSLRAGRARTLAIPAVVLVLAWLASNAWKPYERDRALAASLRNSGVALGQKGENARASELFLQALAVDPRSAETWSNLGWSYLNSQHPNEAADAFRKAIELHAPDLVREHERLSEALGQLGRWSDSISELRSAVALAPKNRDPRLRLAWLLATSPDEHVRNGAEALQLAKAASEEAANRDVHALDVLAAALAEIGRVDEAVATLDAVLQAPSAQRQLDAAKPLRERRALYAQKKPFRLAP